MPRTPLTKAQEEQRKAQSTYDSAVSDYNTLKSAYNAAVANVEASMPHTQPPSKMMPRPRTTTKWPWKFTITTLSSPTGPSPGQQRRRTPLNTALRHNAAKRS